MVNMTLRQNIDQVITEIDQNPSLKSAPLSTIGDMLRRAVEQSAPQALTTLEELDSEAAGSALGLLTPDNTGMVIHWDRRDGKNIWAQPGVGGVYTSEELLEDVDDSYAGGFVVIPRPDTPGESPAPAPLSPLVTPCHGQPLWVSTRSESCFGGYESTEVVDDISCDAPGCLNTWNPDGTVLYVTPVV